MAKLKFTTPTVGEKNTVAEPLVDTALSEIRKVVNGELNTENLEAAAGITEEQLATALQEKLTTKLGFNVILQNGSTTAVSENYYQMEKENSALELPAPTLNRIVGARYTAAAGTLKIKTSSGQIFGDFITGATTINLTINQHVILLANGTNWSIIAGEPQREQVYETLMKVRAASTPATPSATRPTFVTIWILCTEEASSCEVYAGGKEITRAASKGQFPFSFWLNPGQSWEWRKAAGGVSVQSNYLLL